MNLFLDSASSKVCILLFSKDYTAQKIIDVNYQHVDHLVDYFFDFLAEQNCKYSNLEKIYFTNGPGKYIGTKVALILIKIIKIYLPDVRLFVANSLAFATGFNQLSENATLAVSKNYNYFYNKDHKIIIRSNYPQINNHNYALINILLNRFADLAPHFKETTTISMSSSLVI